MTDTLLSRLQSLTEGSREIDAEIALANGWTRGEYSTSHAEPFWFSPDGQQIWRQPPRYTESLDAALTLLPDGLGASIGRPLPKYCGGWYAELFAEGWGNDPSLFWSDSITKPRGKDDYRPNPAIALLIAIMKAREESAEGEGM